MLSDFTVPSGAKLLKFGRKGNPHFKWVKLVDSRLFWSEPEHKKEDPVRMLIGAASQHTSFGVFDWVPRASFRSRLISSCV